MEEISRIAINAKNRALLNDKLSKKEFTLNLYSQLVEKNLELKCVVTSIKSSKHYVAYDSELKINVTIKEAFLDGKPFSLGVFGKDTINNLKYELYSNLHRYFEALIASFNIKFKNPENTRPAYSDFWINTKITIGSKLKQSDEEKNTIYNSNTQKILHGKIFLFTFQLGAEETKFNLKIHEVSYKNGLFLKCEIVDPDFVVHKTDYEALLYAVSTGLRRILKYINLENTSIKYTLRCTISNI